jgi:hypothetical protein
MEKEINQPEIDSSKVYAKCSFAQCLNEAQWVMGTWQCCDECAKQWITETKAGNHISRWGTSSRIGQANILAHNLRFNLTHYLINKK